MAVEPVAQGRAGGGGGGANRRRQVEREVRAEPARDVDREDSGAREREGQRTEVRGISGAADRRARWGDGSVWRGPMHPAGDNSGIATRSTLRDDAARQGGIGFGDRCEYD